MSVEGHVTSVYQLPKFRLTAAPRHVYSRQSQTEDTGYKSSGSQSLDSGQCWQVQQAQCTAPVKNVFRMLQTHECSRKFSSMFSSSQPSPPGHVKVPSSAAVTVKSDDHHIRRCMQTAGDGKVKGFKPSACTAPPYRSTSTCMDGPSVVPLVHQENVRCRRIEKSTVQTNSVMIPSTTRNAVEQPKKVSDRQIITRPRVRSAWKAKVDESHKNRELSLGTFNAVSDSCNDAATKQQNYNNESSNNVNNSNTIHLSNFAMLQLIDHVSYRPASQQKVETGGAPSPFYGDTSKHSISVAQLMQDVTMKGSQMAPAFVIAPSDNADCGSTSRCETPELLTLHSDNATAVVKQRTNDVASCPKHRVSDSREGPVSIKIEKCLISNKPMTICTLPVSRPALVCKSLLREGAVSTKSDLSCSSTVSRSYHETTRSQRHKNLPLTESGGGTERRRSGMISRLPYVGADLWELTTQRLQRAIIDKVSNGRQTEETDNAAESKTGCDVNLSNTSSSQAHGPAERNHLVKKCFSAKTFRPKTERSIRASQSTSHLQEECEEDDEDEAVGDCDIEL